MVTRYMMKEVEVKKSQIHGKGVFAVRNFEKDEIVIKWHPKVITKEQLKSLTRKQKTYIQKMGSKYYLMQFPEKFVNHSTTPNTFALNDCDVAKRRIVKGEEITTRYNEEDIIFK